MAELVTLGVIALLIAVNGLFVAAEFAIIGTPRAGLQARSVRGDRRARRLLAVVADPIRQDRFIATAQLGITLASLGLGMYGEHTLATWIVGWFEAAGWAQWAAAHALASGLSIAILTYFHIVLGEMVPKSLALSSAESTALAVAAPMGFVQRAMLPLVLALNGVGNALLRLVGVDRREDAGRVYTPEELEGLVVESQQQGQIEELPGSLVRELFDFFELTAEQVMVPRVHVVGVPLGAGREELAAVIAREAHTRYPVFEGDLDHVVGFVHVKDLARHARGGAALTRELVRPAALVPGSFSLDRALEAMRSAGAQLAVVLDEHGGTAGILTVEDLFEELVGELEEEAQVNPEIRRLEDGALVAEGTARLAEVGEALGIELEHEDVETVSGLVLDLLGRPPAVGDVVSWEGVELTVATVAGKGVGSCRVRRLPAAPTRD